MKSLRTRHREDEWMDSPDADPDQLRKSLLFIRRINSLLGYTRATLEHLEQFARSWTPGEPITLLDVATGSADIPRAILRWADRRKINVRIIGVDLHRTTLANANVESSNSGLRFVQADATRLPFAEGSFDYAMTNMFLHHLDEDAAVAVMKEMSRVSRRGVIVADLLRSQRAYCWISLFTALANPMVRHDARVSVAQAFSKAEILSLRDRAGLNFAKYHRHFGHRFILAGEKLRTKI